MAEPETAAAEPAQPTADEYYATRTAALKGGTETAAKPEVIPEPETVDLAQKPEPEAKADEPEKAEKAEAEDPADKDGEDEPKEERKPRRTLREENYRLRERNRALNEQLAARPGAQPEQQTRQPDAPPTEAKRPRQEDFENYEAFSEAMIDWKVDQKLQVAESKRARSENERRLADAHRQTVTKFSDSADKARAKYADYDEVVTEPTLMVTPVMATIVSEADNPGELAYWLGQNPQEARRIAGLSPPRAALELGKIDARLATAEPPKPRAIEKPRIPETKAPPPTKTVPQGSARPSRTLEELPQQDFYAKRQAQLRGG